MFGYETRSDTKKFDPLSPNGRLMIAVCAETYAVATGINNALRLDLAAARAEAERAALWAAHLKLHLGELQRKVADFVRGASSAEWRHKEPRIVGFGLEFEEMKRFAALKDPEPPPADATSESRCAALAKECEELRKDKERLDWLENQKGHLGTMHLSQCFRDGMGRNWFTKQIRAAIDAARTHAQEPKP